MPAGKRIYQTLTFRAARRRQQPARRRPGVDGRAARHAAGADGAAEHRLHLARVRDVQGRRRHGADRSRHGPPEPDPLPGRERARRLHRHPAGPGRARAAARPISQGEVQRHRRPPLVLGRQDDRAASRAAAERRLSAGRQRKPTIRRRSSSPPAARARPRACSIATATSTARPTRSATSTASSPARSTCPAFRCSPCSTARWA